VPVPAAESFIKVRREKLAIILLFLVPPALIYIGLVLFPMLQAMYYSLFRWSGLGPAEDFIGFDNFVRMFRDGVFLKALGNNVLIVVLSAGIQLPLALALALLIRHHMPGRRIFRVIFFLPFVLSEVITGVLWAFIFNPQVGLLNTVLAGVIPGFEPQGWLGDTSMVIFAVFAVITWKYFGLHLILYTAGLQNIPAELEEAALIDGASGWQVLRYITIPLLGPTLRLSFYLSVLGALQIFDLVWIMTTGGPVSASETMSTYLYKFGFQRFAIGYGSSVAVVLFAICFGFSFIYQRFVMRRDYAS
jgi:raffinose/stachyose/melibiose transport system permease protein